MEQDRCVICLESLKGESTCISLPECGHTFHATCLLEWFWDTKGSCPLCRREPRGQYRRHMSQDGMIKLCKRLARRKECNRVIRSFAREITKKNKELLEIYRQRAEWKRENEITVKDSRWFTLRIYRKQKQIRKIHNKVWSIPPIVLIEELRKN
jgi:hypothetical protein